MFSFPSTNLVSDIKYNPSQENIGCCTASATLLSAEILYNRINRPVTFSRLYLYYMTRKLQGRLGQCGAELRMTMQALSQFGVCLDIRWPLRKPLVDKEPSLTAIQEATNYKLLSYEEIYNYDYRQYLDRGIPIVVGMNTGRRFWALSGPIYEHKYTPINDTNNRYSRGHALTIVGYSDEFLGGSWVVANSLEPKWGDKGYTAIPYSCNADIGESFAITNFAGNTSSKNFLRIDK